ncbi:NAD(P)H-dependent glycerol-3-phosphate dehydrogenase [Nocardia asteroides]|uniref:NAD(P)H-dependent glycerol-3-phosphate dehydrogenase n=1 Tax=Nocardia asteroides TaxID=1824 RepID=UPI0037B1AC4A
MAKAAVLGAGSWGTAFAMILADAGCSVKLWARRREVADMINSTHVNKDYLPTVSLPNSVVGTSNIATAIKGANFVVLAVTAQTLRSNLAEWAPLLGSNTMMVSLIKGIEAGSSSLMSTVIKDVVGADDSRIVVVSGPNLAGEIAARQPAASVIACRDEANGKLIQEACRTGYFRPYTSTDVIGCEIGGAVKNVISVATGVAEGIGLGDNAKASLITRGLAETARLGIALGARPETFSGLAGMGDLVATSASSLSRNHRFGAGLALGLSAEESLLSIGQTVEGYSSCQSVQNLAMQHGVSMPIVDAVADVISGRRRPQDALFQLMARTVKPEYS